MIQYTLERGTVEQSIGAMGPSILTGTTSLYMLPLAFTRSFQRPPVGQTTRVLEILLLILGVRKETEKK